MKVTIQELPNEWGWHGCCDRTAYAVCVDGRVVTRLCYRALAEARAEAIRKEIAARAMDVGTDPWGLVGCAS